MTQQPKAVFVDAISGQHISSDPQSLLQQRQLTFSKDYGWQYDVWVDDPLKYALSGANSRFSVPAIAQRVHGLVSEAAAFAGQQLHQGFQQLQARTLPSSSNQHSQQQQLQQQPQQQSRGLQQARQQLRH